MGDRYICETPTDIIMFHKAVDVKFQNGTVVEVTFQDGMVKQYDMMVLSKKYPRVTALKDRDLFLSGRLMGYYGIIWNDEIDIETETIYEFGKTVRTERPSPNILVGYAVAMARANKGLSQTELSKATGIDQSDLSKIERGVANPSVNTLKRIADALDTKLIITFQ